MHKKSKYSYLDMHDVDIPLSVSKLKQEVMIAHRMLLKAPFLFIRKCWPNCVLISTFYSLVASLLFILLKSIFMNSAKAMWK